MVLETHVVVIEQHLIDRLLDSGVVTGVTIKHIGASRHALHILSTSETMLDERIFQVFLFRTRSGMRCGGRTCCLLDLL